MLAAGRPGGSDGVARQGYLYILASARNGALYVGVTSDLVRRVHQHRTDAVPGFSSRYGVKQLVHYEVYEDIATAIAREKTVKKWRRKWKLDLIERTNPQWRDLFEEVV